MSPIEIAESLSYSQLPRDGGQIVDVTYATTEYHLYRRRHDRSDGEITYERAAIEDDNPEFEPWNGCLPEVGEWEVL